MNVSEALAILKLSVDANQEIIKKRYKELAKKYHPDLNPVGDQMMKMINAAYETLKDYKPHDADHVNKTNLDSLEGVLKELIKISNITIEIVGSWIWVAGDTRACKESLKKLGLRWSKPRKSWYYCDSQKKFFKSVSRKTFDEIRNTYGSTKVSNYQLAGVGA